MPAELRCTQDTWQRLHDALLPGDGNEHGAIVLCGVGRFDDHTLLLVREVVPLGDGDLRALGRDHLRVEPVTLARELKRAASAGLTLVIAHSHPFGGRVAASPIDLATESELCGRVIADRTGLGGGALILGPSGFDGRWWVDGVAHALTQVRVVGPGGIEVLRLERERAPVADPTADRQVRAWGAEGQARLVRSHVAVVGVGGTGSHVVTQLAHLGVGHLTLVDPDDVEATNLSRLVGATPDDVGRPKVDVLAAYARRVRPDITVDTIADSVLHGWARALARADLIVCATDGHGSRALLTELCAQYLVPVIDLGVEVQAGRDGARAGGGVRVLRPGGWCLHCARTLDGALVREEYLPDHERDAEAARGYVRGRQEPAPSVISLNGVVASLAVLEVCQLLCGFLPPTQGRVLYRAHDRAVTSATVTRNARCHVCGERGLFATGDARRLPTRIPARATEGALP